MPKINAQHILCDWKQEGGTIPGFLVLVAASVAHLNNKNAQYISFCNREEPLETDGAARGSNNRKSEWPMQ